MKKPTLAFLLSLLLFVPAFSQQAEKIDEFGVLPCGDFMARMDGVFHQWEKSPELNIYVVYYGQRYRKSTIRNKKTKSEVIKLDYPNRQDSLSWAKAVPFYLTTMNYYSPEDRRKLESKISLVDGGYEDNRGLEIWLALKQTDIPKTASTYTEKDLVFKARHPLKTPNYTKCYEGF